MTLSRKLGGAVLSRAAHIFFLRVEVKQAHGLIRCVILWIEAGPFPPRPRSKPTHFTTMVLRVDRMDTMRCIGQRRALGNPIWELVG
jgi:hypothetical protein